MNIDKLIASKYSTRLLNDTKWREIFSVISEQENSFFIYWVYSPSVDRFDGSISECTFSYGSISKEGIGVSGLNDGECVGGPFLFKSIERLEIPQETPDHFPPNEIENTFKKLQELGVLPIELYENKIVITGYVPKQDV